MPIVDACDTMIMKISMLVEPKPQCDAQINATLARESCESFSKDDHTLTMTMAITTTMTTAMMMATTTTKKLHQDFSKMILCDFRVSFVSQINWQPIGKLLFMINLGHIRAG